MANGPDLRCEACGHTTTYGDAGMADMKGCDETGATHEWEKYE